MIKGILTFTGGALVGFGAAYLALEDRFGKTYAEMVASNQRAYEKAKGMKPVVEREVDEAQLIADMEDDAVTPVPHIVPTPTEYIAPREGTSKATHNPYHQAVSAVETSSEDFVAGSPTVYGVSYIEEEEYMDEDGRDKFKVDIIIQDTDPIFILDGVPMENWAERVGDSVLLDMFNHCPPGTPQILYVRNHRTDEDYEVSIVQP